MKMDENSNEEIKNLKVAERSEKNKANKRRLQTVRLIQEGYTIAQVRQITDSCEKTVYTCLNRYKAEGISGLATKPSTGKANKLTAKQEQIVGESGCIALPRQP